MVGGGWEVGGGCNSWLKNKINNRLGNVFIYFHRKNMMANLKSFEFYFLF